LKLCAERVVPLLDKAFVEKFTAADLHAIAREFAEAVGRGDAEVTQKFITFLTGEKAV
jgi:hypothetical protein